MEFSILVNYILPIPLTKAENLRFIEGYSFFVFFLINLAHQISETFEAVF